jgi:lipid A 3-O-deacylase
MRFVPLALLFCATAGGASPALAGELFAGVHKHAVKTPLNLGYGLEQGVDLSLGYRFTSIGSLVGMKLQPYVFGAVNSAGDTSYVAAGLSTKFGGRLYVRPGIGLAIHNGATDKFSRPDRIAFGSRILFEPELAVGAQISDRIGIEASLVHLSHAQLFGGQNPGIDNLGVRLNVGL